VRLHKSNLDSSPSNAALRKHFWESGRVSTMESKDAIMNCAESRKR
jgi:hypothetical protein